MLYLVIASLVWGVSFGLMKKYMVGLDPSFVAWGRLALALPVFLPFLRLGGVSRVVLVRLFLIGAFQYGLLYCVYNYAYQYLYGYQVALFTIFAPLYITLIDNMQKRMWNWVNFAMAILAVVGAGMIEWKGGVGFAREVLIGFGIMQVANLCFTLGQMEYRRLRREHEELVDREIFGVLYMGAILVCTVWVTWQGGWESMWRMSVEQMWVLGFLGIMATGVSFFLWNVGAVRVHAGALAVMNNVKVPLAVGVSILVFGEEANMLKLLLGGGLMVFAVWASEYYWKLQHRK